MNETPSSIYDRPPPELVDLNRAIEMVSREPMNAHLARVVGAANWSYVRMVEEHYNQHHRDSGTCDCSS